MQSRQGHVAALGLFAGDWAWATHGYLKIHLISVARRGHIKVDLRRALASRHRQLLIHDAYQSGQDFTILGNAIIIVAIANHP